MIRRVKAPDRTTLLAVGTPAPEGATYDLAFWLTYVANLAIMIGHSLLFRYADVVFFLGGSELLLGSIVGIGMVGSLAMRVAQGVGIDRYGPRRMWILSGLLFIASCLGHLLLTRADTPLIFLLRIGYACAIAGFFGASITFISARAPVSRIAEVVGMLGTSGFLAMVLGTWLGDLLLGGGPMTANHLRLMFCVCAGLGTINVLLALCATWHDDFQPRSRHASAWRLLRRYHPGTVLLVSSATGFGIGLPGTFLRPYAESMDIPGIALFFAVYCPTAFAARFLSRRLPARIGNRRVMHLGLGSMVLAMLLFTVAANQWLLCLPAVALGIAHALLFPSLIAAGTEAFPARNRGLATTLVLAFFDIGTLVGSPIAGGIVSYAGVVGLPPFGTMFVSVAAAIGLSALIYGASRTASASSSGAHSSATNENSLPTAHATQQASSRH